MTTTKIQYRDQLISAPYFEGFNCKGWVPIKNGDYFIATPRNTLMQYSGDDETTEVQFVYTKNEQLPETLEWLNIPVVRRIRLWRGQIILARSISTSSLDCYRGEGEIIKLDPSIYWQFVLINYLKEKVK